jgi:[ribosomal protein S18]-alanine N-acetyltransferase
MRTAVSLKIRPLTRADISACAAIISASDPWKRLGEGFDFTRLLAGDQSGSKSYIMTVKKTAVGFIVFNPHPVFARGGYLRAIGVTSSFQRQGIGRKLMNFAESITAQQAPNFYLCVSSFNRKAQAFYRDLGYRKIGRIPDLLMRGASEYVYWKRLPQFTARSRR